MSKIGVIGAGTWGMALARMLSNSGHKTMVWSALPEEIEKLDKTRRQKNLPNMEIPTEVQFSVRPAKGVLFSGWKSRPIRC